MPARPDLGSRQCASQPRLAHLASPHFYRHLLLVCIALLITLALPGTPFLPSWLGFLYLTLLLLWGLGGLAVRPGRHRTRTGRPEDRAYGALGVATLFAQVLWMGNPSQLRLVGVALILLFILFMAWSLVRLVRTLAQDRQIDGRLLSGATAGYLLLGLSGGLFLTLLDAIHPGGFRDNLTGMPLQLDALHPTLLTRAAWNLDFSRLNYFAFVSLTTVGYGDITPTSPATRLASLSLSVLGPLYIAVVLGLLISRLSGGGPAAPPEPTAQAQQRPSPTGGKGTPVPSAQASDAEL